MTFDTADFINQLHSKSLSEILDQLEIDLSHLGQGNRENAQKMLLKMDYAYKTIAEITQKNLPNKAETAQFEYLAIGMEKNAKAFLRDIGGNEKLEQLRKENSPKKEQHWWFLDEFLNREAKTNLRAATRLVAIIAGVVIVIALVYRFFLMPDPRVTATYDHQVNAEQALSQNDIQKALYETNLALSYSPDDAGLLTLRGVIEEKLGMGDLAGADYAAAEEKLGKHETFLITRAQMWVEAGEGILALADAQAVIQMDPTSAEGYFYMGHADEMLQKNSEAIAAFTKASDLAESQGKVELNGTIRVTLAMLMQSMPVDSQPSIAGTPQASPSPVQK